MVSLNCRQCHTRSWRHPLPAWQDSANLSSIWSYNRRVAGAHAREIGSASLGAYPRSLDLSCQRRARHTLPIWDSSVVLPLGWWPAPCVGTGAARVVVSETSSAIAGTMPERATRGRWLLLQPAETVKGPELWISDERARSRSCSYCPNWSEQVRPLHWAGDRGGGCCRLGSEPLPRMQVINVMRAKQTTDVAKHCRM